MKNFLLCIQFLLIDIALLVTCTPMPSDILTNYNQEPDMNPFLAQLLNRKLPGTQETELISQHQNHQPPVAHQRTQINPFLAKHLNDQKQVNEPKPSNVPSQGYPHHTPYRLSQNGQPIWGFKANNPMPATTEHPELSGPLVPFEFDCSKRDRRGRCIG